MRRRRIEKRNDEKNADDSRGNDAANDLIFADVVRCATYKRRRILLREEVGKKDRSRTNAPFQTHKNRIGKKKAQENDHQRCDDEKAAQQHRRPENEKRMRVETGLFLMPLLIPGQHHCLYDIYADHHGKSATNAVLEMKCILTFFHFSILDRLCKKNQRRKVPPPKRRT